jgi:hypothetical protein
LIQSNNPIGKQQEYFLQTTFNTDPVINVNLIFLIIVISPFILEYQYSNFNKTLSIAEIIRFTREDKYKFLFVEYVTEAIYGFNLCVKVKQTAAINIVKDKTDFTVEGWKIGKEIPTWVLGYDDWVNDVPIHLHGYDTEMMNVNYPDAADSLVVVDETVEEDIDGQYYDGPKDNDTEGQDEQEYWSEAEDSDGDAKTEGTEVQDEEVSWSDDEDTPSALVASADPPNVRDGKWQNEAQEWPTKSATRTTSEYSKYLST